MDNKMSPLDIAESTDSLYTPEELARMGATGSFSWAPGDMKGPQVVDDWR